MALGGEQRLVLVLSMNVYEGIAEKLEGSHRHGATIDPRLAFPRGAQLAGENQKPVLGFDPGGFQSGSKSWLGMLDLKNGLDTGFLTAVAYQLARCPLTEHHSQSIEKNRLPRSRLAREKIETRPESEPDFLDQGKVLYSKFDKHGVEILPDAACFLQTSV